MKKPSFNVSKDGKTVEVDRVVYSTAPVNAGNFNNLRKSNYTKGFRQSTFRELLNLENAAYINQEKDESKKLVQFNREDCFPLVSDTIYYGGGKNLIFAIDYPQLKDGKLTLNEKELTDKLGKTQIGSVIFSDDCFVRAIPRGENSRVYNAFQISGSDYPVFLTGDKLAPEKTAQILDKIKKPVDISFSNKFILGVAPKKLISIPVFMEGEDALIMVGSSLDDMGEGLSSFGVRKSA